MTRNEAVEKAKEYVRTNQLALREIRDVKYFAPDCLDKMVDECPPDLIETYESVRKKFRSHWVVTFEKDTVPGEVSCPESEIICVYDSGEVAHDPNL